MPPLLSGPRSAASGGSKGPYLLGDLAENGDSDFSIGEAATSLNALLLALAATALGALIGGMG